MSSVTCLVSVRGLICQLAPSRATVTYQEAVRRDAAAPLTVQPSLNDAYAEVILAGVSHDAGRRHYAPLIPRP